MVAFLPVNPFVAAVFFHPHKAFIIDIPIVTGRGNGIENRSLIPARPSGKIVIQLVRTPYGTFGGDGFFQIIRTCNDAVANLPSGKNHLTGPAFDRYSCRLWVRTIKIGLLSFRKSPSHARP